MRASHNTIADDYAERYRHGRCRPDDVATMLGKAGLAVQLRTQRK
ncbi:hypothetical protein ACIBHX_14435 [Nonomuraea sp. NPDC050536]